jgi:hypothetical protein
VTVYAFGNAYILWNMFIAIQLFFKETNIGTMFVVIAMISVIYYAIRVSMFHKGSLVSTLKYFAIFTIILGALVYNTSTVIVENVSSSGTAPYSTPVDGIPWGIAEMWSMFTAVQYTLVSDFTQAFSTPSGDNLLNESVGVSIVNTADSATIATSNSYLFQDYNEYIANCVAPGITTGFLNVSELLSAGDATDTASQTYSPNSQLSIWAIMSGYTGVGNAGGNLLTNWYSGSEGATFLASGQSDPSGISTTCGQETTWIQSAIKNYISNNLESALAGELSIASAADFSNDLGAINPYIYNMQQSSQATLMQAIGVNMYAPAILKMAQESGANADSLAVATGTATQSTQSGMIISGELAGKYMPIVFGLFEAIMLGASVLILILVLTHMGTKYLKLLFEMLLMITIWPSLTAIFNYISQIIIHNQYTSLAGLGYSVSSSGTINTYLSSSLAWMGYLSWSVPIFAYAIASGSSYAMSSMVGGLNGALSTEGGKEILSKGNFNSGQVNTNDMNSNKFDVTHTQNTGRAPAVSQNGFEKTSSANGITDRQNNLPGISNSSQVQGTGDGTIGNQKLNTTQGFENGQLTNFISPNLQGTMGKSVTAGYSQNLTNAKSKAETASKNFNSAVSNSKNLSNSTGSNIIGSQKAHYDAVSTTSFDGAVDRTTGLTATQQSELKTQFGLNIAAGESPITAGLSASSSVAMSDTLRSSIDTKFASSMRSNFSKGGSLSYVATGSQGKQLISSLNDVITSGKSYQSAVNNVKTAQNNLSYATQHQGQVTNNAILDFMRNFDKKNGLTGNNIIATAAANNAEYKSLLNNSAPLSAFIAGNPVFTNAQKNINNGAGRIPNVNPSATKTSVSSFYNNHQPSYSPIAGTPTPAIAKAEIAIADKNKKPLDTAHTISNLTPENPALYVGGYVSNFVGTGLTDLARLTHFKGPESWNPGSFKPSITETTTLTPQAVSANTKIMQYNNNLLNKQNKINNNLLSGSGESSVNLKNLYNTNRLTVAGNKIAKSNQDLGLRPSGAPTFPDPNKK